MFQAKHCLEFGHILAVSKHALLQHRKKQVEPYGEPIQQNINSNERYCKTTWAISSYMSFAFFMTAWNHFWTSTALSSWPRKWMLHPWAPWHLQARRMASANKAPGQTVLNVQGLSCLTLYLAQRPVIPYLHVSSSSFWSGLNQTKQIQCGGEGIWWICIRFPSRSFGQWVLIATHQKKNIKYFLPRRLQAGSAGPHQAKAMLQFAMEGTKRLRKSRASNLS